LLTAAFSRRSFACDRMHAALPIAHDRFWAGVPRTRRFLNPAMSQIVMNPISYLLPQGTGFVREAHRISHLTPSTEAEDVGEGLLNSVSFGAAGSVHGTGGDIGVALGTVIGLVVDPFAAAGAVGSLTARLGEVIADFRTAHLSDAVIDSSLEERGLLTGKAALSWQAAAAAKTAKYAKATRNSMKAFAKKNQPIFGDAASGVEMTRGSAPAAGGMSQSELESLIGNPMLGRVYESFHIEPGTSDVGVHSVRLPNGDVVKTGDLTTREFKPTSSAVANKVVKVLNGGKNLQHVAVYVGKVARNRSGKYVPSDDGDHSVVEHWGPGGAKVTLRPVSSGVHFEAKITPKQFGYGKVPAESNVARLAARDRALAVVGKGSYRASVENCQHVAGYILTGKAESPEAARIIKNVATGAATAGMAGARLSLLKPIGKRKRNESVQPGPGPGPGPGPSPDPNIPNYGGDAFGFWEYSRRLHKWVFV